MGTRDPCLSAPMISPKMKGRRDSLITRWKGLLSCSKRPRWHWFFGRVKAPSRGDGKGGGKRGKPVRLVFNITTQKIKTWRQICSKKARREQRACCSCQRRGVFGTACITPAQTRIMHPKRTWQERTLKCVLRLATFISRVDGRCSRSLSPGKTDDTGPAFPTLALLLNSKGAIGLYGSVGRRTTRCIVKISCFLVSDAWCSINCDDLPYTLELPVIRMRGTSKGANAELLL